DSAVRRVRKIPELGSESAVDGGEDDFKYILAGSDGPHPADAVPGERVGVAGRSASRTAARNSADGDDEGPGAPGKRRPRGRSFWRELPVLIVIALVIALVIKTFVVQAFFIPSSSMEN